jgi:hypothetical protein
MIEAREGKGTREDSHWMWLDSEAKRFTLKSLFLDHSVQRITSVSETASLNNITYSHFRRIISFSKIQ